MAIDLACLFELRETGVRSYAVKDTILYALGVGAGRDLSDPDDLALVYERAGPRVLPSMATVLARGAALLDEAGVTVSHLLHVSQQIRMHRPLPSASEVRYESRFVDCVDQGERGARLWLETELRSDAHGELICTLTSCMLARADGGFGGPSERRRPPRRVPDRTADAVTEVVIRPEQGALYRLNGDENPLHIDPAAARSVGFDRPILHGLCTYGSVCRVLVAKACGGDPDRLQALDATFASPVYPGETLSLEVWREATHLAFRAKIAARQTVALDHGVCELA